MQQQKQLKVYEQQLLDVLDYIKTKYPHFSDVVDKAVVMFDQLEECPTAFTDGSDIYINSEFWLSLNASQQVFLLAHEMMHIKFNHIFRMAYENGKMRDNIVWNIATDAIINANLINDGIEKIEGLVEIPDALNYDAEELYDMLMQDMGAQDEEQEQGDNNEGNQDGDNDDASCDEDNGNNKDKEQKENKENNKKENNSKKLPDWYNTDGILDDHSKWEEIAQENISKGNTNTKYQSEKQEFEENTQERKQNAKRNLNKLKNSSKQEEQSINIEKQKRDIGPIGESEKGLDWDALIKHKTTKTEDVWGNRRSIKQTNYAYRLEEREYEENAITEVVIDTSASVSDDMVRAFLRQLKTIAHDTTIKVKFFALSATEDWVEIKDKKDIDNLDIVRPGDGTNMDCAIRAFSYGKNINKFIFTDGWPSEMPHEDTVGLDAVWLVYDNVDFNPICGQVQFVDPVTLKIVDKNKIKNTKQNFELSR